MVKPVLKVQYLFFCICRQRELSYSYISNVVTYDEYLYPLQSSSCCNRWPNHSFVNPAWNKCTLKTWGISPLSDNLYKYHCAAPTRDYRCESPTFCNEYINSHLERPIVILSSKCRLGSGCTQECYSMNQVWLYNMNVIESMVIYCMI